MERDTGKPPPRPPSRGDFKVVPYDSRWPDRYGAEQARLAAGLGATAVRIEHVGSTSVPGLAAKPVIDIQISVSPLHPLGPLIAVMGNLAYRHRSHPDDATYPCFHRPHDWPHSHHVHLCEAGGEEEQRHLAFRDYLRDHPEDAREYAALKRRLVPLHSAADADSRNAFSEAKSGFIEPLIERAIELGYPGAAPPYPPGV